MRQLQLKRFDIIFKSREIALNNLSGQSSTYKDGEVMSAAYYKTSGNTTEDNIATILGMYVSKGDKSKLVTIDVADIKDEIASVRKLITDTTNELDYAKDVKRISGASYTTATTDNYEVTMSKGKSKNFRLFFTPITSDEQKVSASIGDIKAGTPASELKKKTLSQLLDEMLFKTIYPTITKNAYVTITPKAGTSAVGTSVEFGTKITAIDHSYSQGQAKLIMESGDGETFNYTGAETSTELKYKGPSDSSEIPFPNSGVTLGYGTYTFSATVNYAAGAPLRDSKGNSGTNGKIKVFSGTSATATSEVPNPHPTGSVRASKTISTFYYVGWNGGQGTTITTDNTDIKKSGIKCESGFTIDFKTDELKENGKVKQGGGYQIAIPHGMITGTTPTAVLQFNEGSGKFDAKDTTNWTLNKNANFEMTGLNGQKYICDLLTHKDGTDANSGSGTGRVAYQINF